MRNLNMHVVGLVVAVAGGMLSLPATAVQWNSSNASPSGTQSSGGCTGNANSPSSGVCEQFTITVGSDVLKVRAYSTQTYQSTTTGTVDTTKSWLTADLANYSGGGFAVSNRVASDQSSEGSSPEHAADNENIMDVLVFELPQNTNQVWDLEKFRLGWAHEGNSFSGTESGKADIQAWFGGQTMAANYDFTEVCFSACTLGTDKTVAQLGLTDVTAGLTQSGCTGQSGGNNVCQNIDVNLNGTQQGRYLVLSAKHGALDTTGSSFGLDHFKVNMLKASTTPGTGQSPAPGTLALLGLGLVGILIRKRRAVNA